MSLPSPRDWQNRAVETAREYLIKDDKEHMYLCAPTGTGKSRAIFEIIEQVPVPGTHYLTVGMGAIVIQHRNSFISYGCKLLSEDDESEVLVTPEGNKIVIETWQTLASQARRFVPVDECGYLIFDECHVGGASEDNISFPAIRAHFQPKKLIYVSATIQSANEILLGTKNGHVFTYSMSEAYQDGLLNPVHLVEVHSGTEGRIARIENAHGKNIEQLEVLSSNDLNDLAAQLAGIKVSLTEDSVQRIIEHRHDVMIGLYADKHRGQQAIFFSPTIEAAEAACERFNKKMGKAARGDVIHSDRRDSSDIVARFLGGGIRVLFVVGMLQEGFDMPSLALAFDCRFYRKWNAPRIARFLQKVGRLMRTEDGKNASKYYYARDIMDYYNGYDANEPDAPDLAAFALAGDYVAGEISDEDFAADAAGAVAKALIEANGGLEDHAAWSLGSMDVEQGDVENSELDIDDKPVKVRTVATVLCRLFDVSSMNVVQSVDLVSLMGQKSDSLKIAILAIPVGEKRPTQDTVLGRALMKYICAGSTGYDAALTALLAKRHPLWWIGSSKTEFNKKQLLAIPQGAPRPKREGLGIALLNYTNSSGGSYDIEFKEAIRKRQPHWFKNREAVDTSPTEKKKMLLEMPTGSPAPATTTVLGRAFKYYTSKSRQFDAEFAAKIRERHPQWFKHTKAEKISFLLAIPPGEKRPDQKTRLGEALSSYLNKATKSYDPDFAAMMRAKHPQWFRDKD